MQFGVVDAVAVMHHVCVCVRLTSVLRAQLLSFFRLWCRPVFLHIDAIVKRTCWQLETVIIGLEPYKYCQKSFLELLRPAVASGAMITICHITTVDVEPEP